MRIGEKREVERGGIGRTDIKCTSEKRGEGRDEIRSQRIALTSLNLRLKLATKRELVADILISCCAHLVSYLIIFYLTSSLPCTTVCITVTTDASCVGQCDKCSVSHGRFQSAAQKKVNEYQSHPLLYTALCFVLYSASHCSAPSCSTQLCTAPPCCALL